MGANWTYKCHACVRAVPSLDRMRSKCGTGPIGSKKGIMGNVATHFEDVELLGLRLRELLLRKVETRLDGIRLAAVGQEILWAVFLIC
jgi:hypothetical protein